MTRMKASWRRKTLEILAIATGVTLFFMGLVTLVDKLAYGEDRLMKEVPTYSIIINKVEYKIPTVVPQDFNSWPIRVQRLSNPEYGLIQWTNSETSVRFTALIHTSNGDIKVATFGVQGIDATHWWIWQEDGKVYEVDSETGKEYVRYCVKLRTV